MNKNLRKNFISLLEICNSYDCEKLSKEEIYTFFNKSRQIIKKTDELSEGEDELREEKDDLHEK